MIIEESIAFSGMVQTFCKASSIWPACNSWVWDFALDVSRQEARLVKCGLWFVTEFYIYADFYFLRWWDLCLAQWPPDRHGSLFVCVYSGIIVHFLLTSNMFIPAWWYIYCSLLVKQKKDVVQRQNVLQVYFSFLLKRKQVLNRLKPTPSNPVLFVY